MINDEKLINELKQEGASQQEAEELSLLSKNLSNLVSFERSFETKVQFLKQKGKSSSKVNSFRKPLFASMLAVLIFTAFATIVSAQDSLPGTPLYPIKRATENIISGVNPNFKGEILIRRSNEIKKLSNPENNNSKNLMDAIKDYESYLNERRKINIKDIEESKDNLEEASKMATNSSRLEIEDILKQTEQRKQIQESENNQEREYQDRQDDSEHQK